MKYNILSAEMWPSWVFGSCQFQISAHRPIKKGHPKGPHLLNVLAYIQIDPTYDPDHSVFGFPTWATGPPIWATGPPMRMQEWESV